MFELCDFVEGKKYEIWVKESVNDSIGNSLLHTIIRQGDVLTDVELGEEYSIDALNESLKEGEEWSKREYDKYICIGYSNVMV